MNDGVNKAPLTEEIILKDIVDILEEMTSDWDIEFSGPIGAGTKIIADLSFESIDVVQFIVAIEEHFQIRGLPFEELIMVDGRYVDEVEVGETVSFLHKQLNLS